MAGGPLHATQLRLQKGIDRQTKSMVADLSQSKRTDFHRFNTGIFDEDDEENAHMPLPGVAIFEDRKEEYHEAYMAELGKKMGISLRLKDHCLSTLSRGDKRRITKAHHDKMQWAAKRVVEAQSLVLSRILSEGRRFRRHPASDGWEKISCFAGADEYLFFRKPDAVMLTTGMSDFWGSYFICYSDKEHMDVDHVLMTCMQNLLASIPFSQRCWSVASFRVDLDLAELMLQRIGALEAQLKVPLGQARHLELELKLSDRVGELQELLDTAERYEVNSTGNPDLPTQVVAEEVDEEVLDRLATSMAGFVRELNQVLNALKTKPAP